MLHLEPVELLPRFPQQMSSPRAKILKHVGLGAKHFGVACSSAHNLDSFLFASHMASQIFFPLRLLYALFEQERKLLTRMLSLRTFS